MSTAVHTVVIGAGQAGLAVSHCLAAAGIDHVVLERGRIAERWRSERWDSLRLLSPNWASRLPGWSYAGPEPDGYMSAAELATYLGGYAASFAAPVEERTEVVAVRHGGDGVARPPSRGTWRAANVVVATGWCDRPHVPALARRLPPDVVQVVPSAYRNASHLPAGRVLVVGASATGVQLADELAGAGRDVVLAVGRHSRMPRRYRGMDVWWWLERIGTFARTVDDVADPAAARAEGSLQLVGSDDHRVVDLRSLRRRGVRLAGRLTAIDGRTLTFADDLAATTAAADQRLARLLADIDAHIAGAGLADEVLPASRPEPVGCGAPVTRLDARRGRLAAVVWATGYRRAYPWLHAPAVDAGGEIVQRRGVTPVPGLYVVGQRFQHRRDANFVDGVRHDAAHVAGRIAGDDHDRCGVRTAVS